MSHISKLNKFIWAFLVLAALLACSTETPSIPPNQLASGFYDSIIHKDFKKAVSYYGGERPAEAHIQELQELEAKLGDLQSYKLQDSEVNTVFSGTRYILTYRLQYANAKITELLILFQSVRGGPLHIEHRNYEIKDREKSGSE